MDIKRITKDLDILTKMQQYGSIREVDWSNDQKDPWIIILGAFELQPGRFNLSYCNLKIPIPINLYDPVAGQPGKYFFYQTIFIDEKLRQKGSFGRWIPIRRQFIHDVEEAGKGWAFLCLYPDPVGIRTDIRALFPIIQRFLFSQK